jgi:hypothetical protein
MKKKFLMLSFLVLGTFVFAQNNFSLMQSDEKLSLVNKTTNESTVLDIDNYEVFVDYNVAQLEKKGKKGIVDLRYGKLSCCEFDDLEIIYYHKFYILYKKGNERGIATIDTLNGNLKSIISGKFDDIYNVADVSFELKKDKNYFLFLSTTDQIILESKQAHSLEFFGNFFTAYSNGKYTLFNLNGEKLLDTKFNVFDFGKPDGSAIILSQGIKLSAVYNAISKKFLVNPIKGSIITDLILGKYFEVFDEKINTLVDINTGNPVLSLSYKINSAPIHDRYFIIEKKGKFGIYDSQSGKIAVKCKYSDEESALSDSLLDNK